MASPRGGTHERNCQAWNNKAMQDVRKFVVILTEALDGWGPAVTERLLEIGATVVSIGHSETTNPNVTWLPCDLEAHASIARSVAKAVELFGRVDSLVHTAHAHTLVVPADRSNAPDVSGARRYLKTAHTTTGSVIPQMIAQESGSVVLFSSLFARRSRVGSGPVSMCAAGVTSLTEQLASEVGTRGVRVNAIAPGLVDGFPRDGPSTVEPDLGRISLGRVGTPADLANVAAFLVGAESSYITGHTIPVDGGWF